MTVTDAPTAADLYTDRAVVAAIMQRPALLDEVPWLTAEMVDGRGLPLILRVILGLHSAGGVPTPAAIAQELQRRGEIDRAGGPTAISDLVGDLSAAVASFGTDAELIRRRWTGRQVLAITRQSAQQVQGGVDPTDVAARIRQQLDRVEALQAEPGREALFRRWSTTELLDEDRTFRWLMRGVLAHPTYGTVGGERKTLKSYVLTVLALAQCSGMPAFGRFGVDEPRPVLMYVGEGGRLPFTRRLERIASAMSVDLRSVPLYQVFDVDAVLSSCFQQSLARDLADLQPGLVAIDPLYAYHGASVDARNLHEEGALLTALSQPCLGAGASLLVANHFNKTGSGTGLNRITMSGSAEWSDTWLLLDHRTEPDVARGRFRLRLEIGSRQWGGSRWDLDLDLGAFDVDLGEFTGDISWHICRAEVPVGAEADHAAAILDLLRDEPYQHTKTEIVRHVGGKTTTTNGVFDVLVQNHQIRALELRREEKGRRMTRPLWGLAGEPLPEAGTPGQGKAS